MRLVSCDNPSLVITFVNRVNLVGESKGIRLVAKENKPLNLVNLGRKGDQGEKGEAGEGLDNFSGDLLALYYLARG